jgi:hypothetical protein
MTSLTTQGFAPTSITEAIKFSEMLAKSNMVPRAYQGKPEDILVCVQWGYEIGLAPMQALQNIAVINGKPSVYGDAAMALVLASPVCEGIEESIEDEGTTNPVAVCIARRRGRAPVESRFSVEMPRGQAYGVSKGLGLPTPSVCWPCVREGLPSGIALLMS